MQYLLSRVLNSAITANLCCDSKTISHPRSARRISIRASVRIAAAAAGRLEFSAKDLRAFRVRVDLGDRRRRYSTLREAPETGSTRLLQCANGKL